jgi:hypothetical protein
MAVVDSMSACASDRISASDEGSVNRLSSSARD